MYDKKIDDLFEVALTKAEFLFGNFSLRSKFALKDSLQRWAESMRVNRGLDAMEEMHKKLREEESARGDRENEHLSKACACAPRGCVCKARSQGV